MPERLNEAVYKVLFCDEFVPSDLSAVEQEICDYVSSILVDAESLRAHVLTLSRHRSPITPDGVNDELIPEIVSDGVVDIPVTVLVHFSRRPDLLAFTHELIWEFLPDSWLSVIDAIDLQRQEDDLHDDSSDTLAECHQSESIPVTTGFVKGCLPDSASFSRTMNCSPRETELLAGTSDDGCLVAEICCDESSAKVIHRADKSTLILVGTFSSTPYRIIADDDRFPVVKAGSDWIIQGHPRSVMQTLQNASRCDLVFSVERRDVNRSR